VIMQKSPPHCAKILGVFCLLAALIAGCEIEDSSDSDVTLSPSSASIDASETNTIEFTASGGTKTYAWSMNHEELGTLYVATTNTARALYLNFTNAVGTNLITVRDSQNYSANARIVQK